MSTPSRITSSNTALARPAATTPPAARAPRESRASDDDFTVVRRAPVELSPAQSSSGTGSPARERATQLAKQLGAELTPAQLAALDALLYGDVYLKLLDLLPRVKSGALSVADAHFEAMELIAAEAAKYGPRLERQMFSVLCQQLMSKGSRADSLELGRQVLGTAGAADQGTFDALLQAAATSGRPEDRGSVNQGYNPNVFDTATTPPAASADEPLGSTISHHFAEFLQAGAYSMELLAVKAQEAIDDPSSNPGDVRLGYFAIMLGHGLQTGELTPGDAIRLARWALSARSAGVPWGDSIPASPEANAAHFTSYSQFALRDWLEAYRAAGSPSGPLARHKRK